MAHEPPLAVKVWGDFACFTRPEMKVERVSYPVMTPSAARGVLEAIFWKPEFSWQVEEIWVLNPIQYVSFRRNELIDAMSAALAQGWARNGGGLAIDELDARGKPKYRAQRNTLTLRNVAYVIHASPEPHNDNDGDRAKFRDQFRRRVARGQCFATPYLGCREFSASFAQPEGSDRPISDSGSLGRMLLEMEYEPEGAGIGRPRFFSAQLDRGVLRIPKPTLERSNNHVA